MADYILDCIVCGEPQTKSQATIDTIGLSVEVFFCAEHRESDIPNLDMALIKCRPSDARLRGKDDPRRSKEV